MTKSFPLSVLVAALPVMASFVPMAFWLAFDTPGRQGVSALPALVPTLLIALQLARTVTRAPPWAGTLWGLIMLIWQGLLWTVCLTPSAAPTLARAFADLLSDWLYAAPTALLISLAGAIATLGLMMSCSPVRRRQD